MKKWKACRPDNTANELIRYGGTALTLKITKLLKQIFDTSKVPTKFKECITIHIFKKEN